jgi:hypothetical protein
VVFFILRLPQLGRGLELGVRKVKDFTQRERRKSGEKSEKGIYRRDAENGNGGIGSKTVPG